MHALRTQPASRSSSLIVLAPLVLGLFLGCAKPGPGADGGGGSGGPTNTGSGQGPLPPKATPVLGYEVVARYPHDTGAYTQGLFIHDGVLYESTGRPRESTLRIVELETGKVLKSTPLGPEYFGEGIAPFKGLIYYLTWQERTVFVFDRRRLTEQYRYRYEGEGWGLTFDGTHFWMSDGTSELRVMKPEGFEEVRRLRVMDGTRPIDKLNELEWIDGKLWANVWQTDRIARIDPETGHVEAWIDLSKILGDYRVKSPADEVLNGIAWDAEKQKLFVTGKYWPWLYEIRVVPKPPVR